MLLTLEVHIQEENERPLGRRGPATSGLTSLSRLDDSVKLLYSGQKRQVALKMRIYHPYTHMQKAST
jgi:hypothetical protein